MNQVLPTPMTTDEFLRWSARTDDGRYELEGGRVLAIPSESVGHVRAKRRVEAALALAIDKAGIPYYSLPDGVAVRIDERRAYEPDAVVAPLPYPPDTALEIDKPIIVVEVLSTWSIKRDLTAKVVGYGHVRTIEHYVVIDWEERQVLHFQRKGNLLLPPEAPHSTADALRLYPPGIEVAVADILGPPPAT